MYIGYIQHSALLEMLARGYSDTNVSLPLLTKREGKLSLVFLTWQAVKGQKHIPAPDKVVYASLVNSTLIIEDAITKNIDSIMYSPHISDNKQTKLLVLLSKVVDSYLVNHKLPAHLYLSYLEQMVALYPKDFYPLIKYYNHPNYNIQELDTK